MKVCELIEALEKMPPHMDVAMYSDSGGYYSDINIKAVLVEWGGWWSWDMSDPNAKNGAGPAVTIW